MSIKRTIIAAIVGLTLVALVAPGVAQGVTIEELLAQIAQLQAQLAQLQAQQGGGTVGGGIVPANCVGVTFTRNLTVGSSGSDVKCLQSIFNQSADTRLAASGVGSLGNETMYFGPLTKAAAVKYQEKYAVSILAPVGLTYGTGFVGPSTRSYLNTVLAGGGGGGGTVIPTGSGLSVYLASTNPASGTIVDGQAQFPMARLTFTNGDNAEVTVTGLKLKRIGVSADASLTNVYLFNGATRLTDGASVSSTIITFNDTSGLFKVPAGGTVTITVTADVDGESGETAGVQLVAATDITTNASSVNGVFPLSGNLHTIATGTLASFSFNTTTTPAEASVDPQDDYPVFQNSVTVGTRAVDLKRISFRKTGSVSNTDLQNFELYIDGVKVGSTMQLDSNGYVTFDMTSSPKRLEAGTRVVKVLADIIGGSSLNFTMHVWSVADTTVVDSQYNANILVQANSATFSKRSTGAQTVNSGTLTVTKMTDSPSGNIVDAAANATLAKFQLKAAGEKVKVETLYVSAVVSDASVGYLRNGALYANGVQIGSTSNLYDNGYTTAYTTFNLGSSLIVEPGNPVTLEVRADIYDNDSTNDISAGDTIAVRIEGSSSWDNGLGMTSASSVDVPSADVDGNTLTVATGALTLSKYTAYTNQTVVAPLTAQKIAHYTLTANTTEDVNLSSIEVDPNAVISSYGSNLYVVYGSNTGTIKPTIAATNSWSINYTLAKGQTIDLMVYADMNSSASGTGTVGVYVNGTTASSATSVCADTNATCTVGSESALTGQNIVFSSGTFTTAFEDIPLDQVVYGGSGGRQIEAGRFKFTSAYEKYTITELRFTCSDASAAIASAVVKDGSTVLATVPYDNTNSYFNFTGLSVEVPASTSKTLTLDYVLAPNVSPTSSNWALDTQAALTYAKYQDPNGTVTEDTNTRTGNNTFVYRAMPVLYDNPLTNSILINGAAKDLYSFKVKAEGGDISLKQFKLTLTFTDGGTADTLELESLKLFKDASDLTDSVTIQTEDGASIESTDGATEGDDTIVVTRDGANEIKILSGNTSTFTLRATPQGFGVNGATDTVADSVAIGFTADTSTNPLDAGGYNYINVGTSTTTILKLYTTATANASAEAANMIWSDSSAVSHSASTTAGTNDWTNSYLLKDTLSSQAWSNK